MLFNPTRSCAPTASYGWPEGLPCSLFHSGISAAQPIPLTAIPYPSGFAPYDMFGSVLPVDAGGRLFYVSESPSAGRELVSATADLSSALLMRDIYSGSGSSEPSGITAIGNKVVFTASDGLTGNELYVSDGTAAGTLRLTDLVTGSVSTFPLTATAFGFGSYTLFESISGIVATDGTASGTRLILAKRANQECHVFSVGGRAILYSQNQFAPDSLFLYSYAPETKTLLIQDDYLGFAVGSGPLNVASVGDRFIVGMLDRFMLSDETRQGTHMITQFGSQDLEDATEFFPFDGRMYFAARTRSTGNELFSIDPATGVVRLEADINQQGNGQEGSDINSLIQYGDSLYFLADDGFFGQEVYKFKGGAFSRVTDIAPGQEGLDVVAIDSTPGGVLITNASLSPSNAKAYLYRNGRLTESSHRWSGMLFGAYLYRFTNVFRLPETGMRLGVFRGASFPILTR